MVPAAAAPGHGRPQQVTYLFPTLPGLRLGNVGICLLYTSDAADERSSVDLGGRRIIKKKNIAEDATLAVSNSKVQQTLQQTDEETHRDNGENKGHTSR